MVWGKNNLFTNWVYKLKNDFYGVENDQKSGNLRHEKSRRFGVFLVRFYRFLSFWDPIGIYRKTAPTKSTVLGPDPPPWENL
jgi:hypothetical protein